MVNRHRVLLGGVVIGALILAGCTSDDSTLQPSGTPSVSQTPTEQTSPEWAAIEPEVVRTVATGLAVPWGHAVLRDGGVLVSQRTTGEVVLIRGDDVSEVGTVPDVVPQGEGGLLGLAVRPDDESEVFVYLSTATDNRVVALEFDGSRLGSQRTVLSGLPLGSIHQGGQLLFDAEGYLLVAVGDADQAELAQDTSSLAGKILRIDINGEPAPDNPFNNEVYSYGHRNVQGLAFDSDGELWASEFGWRTADELNRIIAGSNYGWPIYEGDSDDDQFVAPAVTWEPAEASPSGLTIVGDTAFLGALRGQRLWAVDISDPVEVSATHHFGGEFGRIRSVINLGDGLLWISTSNTDGRGDPGAEDDRIIELRVAERQ